MILKTEKKYLLFDFQNFNTLRVLKQEVKKLLRIVVFKN